MNIEELRDQKSRAEDAIADRIRHCVEQLGGKGIAVTRLSIEYCTFQEAAGGRVTDFSLISCRLDVEDKETGLRIG